MHMTELPRRLAHRSRQHLTVMLSTVSSDAHTWNLVFLQLLLEEMGHRVINLGPCVPDELLLEECRRHRPDVVVISTVNGHGHIDGVRVVRRLRAEAAFDDVPVLIGGKLTTGSQGTEHVTALLAAGCNAVFEDSTDLTGFRRYLDQVVDRVPALEES